VTAVKTTNLTKRSNVVVRNRSSSLTIPLLISGHIKLQCLGLRWEVTKNHTMSLYVIICGGFFINCFAFSSLRGRIYPPLQGLHFNIESCTFDRGCIYYPCDIRWRKGRRGWKGLLTRRGFILLSEWDGERQAPDIAATDRGIMCHILAAQHFISALTTHSYEWPKHTRPENRGPHGVGNDDNYLLWCSNVYVRSEVFTAVTMKNGVFWVVTPHGVTRRNVD
jgi:hypothetical protein